MSKLVVSFLLSILFFALPLHAQINPKINWLSIQEASQLQKSQPKNFLFYIHISECGLCGEEIKSNLPPGVKLLDENGQEKKSVHEVGCVWCRKLEDESWRDTSIISYLNRHYYAVAIDASREDTVLLNGKNYFPVPIPNPDGKKRMYSRIHGLVSYLTGKENAGFPALAIFDKNLSKAGVVAGYKSTTEIKEMLQYVVEGRHENLDLNTYLNQKNAATTRKLAIDIYAKADDPAYANKLFRKAYQMNKTSPHMLMWLSVFFKQGECEFEQNEAKAQEIAKAALPLLKPLLNQDNDEAKFLWGMAHMLGLGMEADMNKGLAIIRQIIREGDGYIPAVVIYAAYTEAMEDYETAYALHSFAATSAVARSMLSLGKYYEKGKGVKQDLEKAKEWYQEACKRKQKEACEILERRFGGSK